jgi:hypothetical protein
MDAQDQGRLTIDPDQHLTRAAPPDGAGVIANAFYTSEYHGDYQLISTQRSTWRRAATSRTAGWR